MSDEIDLRLAGLSHRTAGVKPRAGFDARVMAAIQGEADHASMGLDNNTWRLGWRVLPVALLLASVALFLEMKSSSFYDDALLGAYDDATVELGW